MTLLLSQHMALWCVQMDGASRGGSHGGEQEAVADRRGRVLV